MLNQRLRYSPPLASRLCQRLPVGRRLTQHFKRYLTKVSAMISQTSGRHQPALHQNLPWHLNLRWRLNLYLRQKVQLRPRGTIAFWLRLQCSKRQRWRTRHQSWLRPKSLQHHPQVALRFMTSWSRLHCAAKKLPCAAKKPPSAVTKLPYALTKLYCLVTEHLTLLLKCVMRLLQLTIAQVVSLRSKPPATRLCVLSPWLLQQHGHCNNAADKNNNYHRAPVVGVVCFGG